jgi:NAD+ diphosphatase
VKRGNVLSGLDLDRAVDLRGDPARVEEAWRRPDTKVIPLWRSRHLLASASRPEIVSIPSEKLDEHRERRILLGTSGGRAFFALDLSSLDDPARDLELDGESVWLPLREVAALLPQSEGALLAYASGIASWHRRHLHCGVCGSATEATHGGHVRACGNEGCKELHFPRTDPAVIMLVGREDELLLGRQKSWNPGVYSTLAGFVEPGESLEEAVRREVYEETGVELEDVRYHSSQPWPFPSSLMLGFTARARTREIRLQPEEMEDARWFTRRQVRERDGLELPSSISIARRLIEDWLNDEI